MQILVTYASKHGSTRGIAEGIGDRLTAAGHPSDVRRVQDASNLSGYDAVVVGGATYLGHWMKDATSFVRRHHELLAQRPVWLFSSGPLGTEPTDAEGHDLRESAAPGEFAELADLVHARGSHVFFGALYPDRLRLGERMVRAMPAGRALLPEGDFRDWIDVDRWAHEIAHQLGHQYGHRDARPGR